MTTTRHSHRQRPPRQRLPAQVVLHSDDVRALETLAQRAIEQQSLAQPASLMQRAGLAAAEWARRVLPDTARRLLILAGPGNNGGDAFEMARHLMAWHYRVQLVFIGDIAALPTDARAACERWQEAGGVCLPAVPTLPAGQGFDAVVDGLFGLGLGRDLTGEYEKIINKISNLEIFTLALDVPSGLCADRGVVRGCCLRADHTLSFITLKPGLLTGDGPDYCGQLAVADLGLDVQGLLQQLREQQVTGLDDGWLLDHSALTQLDRWLPPRALNFHKGMAGSVGVLGGAPGMCGAALLAGRAALKMGAGKVTLALLDEQALRVDPLRPELMFASPEQLLRSPMTVLVVGPGLGQSPRAAALLQQAMDFPGLLLLDADALNLIAAGDGQDINPLRAALAARRPPTVITPHPAEAARLMACSTAEIQTDRVRHAQHGLGHHYHCHVVLKGNGSVLAMPHATGRAWRINPSGHPGMASAGMGDVLAGLCAGLLAQGLAVQAKCQDHTINAADASETQKRCIASILDAAVWLHGASAEQLATQGIGPIGTCAGELIDAARALRNPLHP